MTTFQQRALTATVFTSVMLLGMFLHEGTFILLFFIISMGCLWEYMKLMTDNNRLREVGALIIGNGLWFVFMSKDHFVKGFDAGDLTKTIAWAPNVSIYSILLFAFVSFLIIPFVLLIVELFEKSDKPFQNVAGTLLGIFYAIVPIFLLMEVPGYTREKFLEDLCNETEKDIRQAFAAGAERVSVDFTEGRLSCRNDSRNPWTGRKMLGHFIELNNRVINRFTPEERKKIGIHTCPGGDCDSVHSADVPYNDLLPSMFQINAGYFLIQLASERNKEQVYKDIGASLRGDANGIPQVAYIGVINPGNPRVESAQEVCDALVTAAKYIPKMQLGSTDDCGFSPFSIDVKPNHGSPDYARDVAFQKITNRILGTKMAAEKLGVH